MAAHATKGIVISYGLSTEGGFLNYNPRPIEEIAKRIENHGFKYKKEDSQKMAEHVSDHFKNTLMVFEKATPMK